MGNSSAWALGHTKQDIQQNISRNFTGEKAEPWQSNKGISELANSNSCLPSAGLMEKRSILQ